MVLGGSCGKFGQCHLLQQKGFIEGPGRECQTVLMLFPWSFCQNKEGHAPPSILALSFLDNATQCTSWEALSKSAL